jgi:prepilin-type N-terminal cleavage/methylation domain-containing protein
MLKNQISMDQSYYPARHLTMRSELLARFSAGFTMIELVVVIAIIAVLVSLVIPAYEEFVIRARNSRAMQEIRVMETEIQGYVFMNGELPESLADINRGDLRDPWGQVYVYNDFRDTVTNPPRNKFGNDLNTDFDIYSTGRDRLSTDPLVTSVTGKDDLVRGGDGLFVGLGEEW